MRDIGRLIVRLAVGGLVAGHGGQKLFGWFSGPGIDRTSQWVESMGMRPGAIWGPAAGMSEFGGGVLTALGFLNPVGPLGIISAMTVAIRKAHWGKPIWVTAGGAELPLINAAVATALVFAGPGKFSLDAAFGIRLPAWLRALAIAGTVAGIVAALKPELIQQAMPGSQQPQSSDQTAM